MSNTTSELIHFIIKGRAAAFALELQNFEEEGQRVSLEAETFSKLTINKFHFRGIDFTNVAFEHCNLGECVFEDCNLEGTFFDGTALLDCRFVDCRGEGFAMDTCTINKSTFTALELESPEWNDTQFQSCDFEKVTLIEPLLERVSFREGAFAGLIMDSGDLTHVEFRNVEGLSTCSVEESETQRCYVVGLSDGVELPAGFMQKSGKRRTL